MANQEVILTVPASFDASARELTLKAAQQAGLPDITLLEEPQAALYAWCEAMGESFRKQVRPGEVILVVDVGGGTTDFSLIAVSEKEGEVQLVRLAVGNHILLGGDNMDLALAHAVSQRLAAGGKKLDTWQFNALTFACRQAKELLFSDEKLDKAALTIPGRGSSLIGGAIKAELLRDELTRILTDGFFPVTPVTEMPQTGRRAGLAQMSLPYAQDAAVTRHLASFLQRQARAFASAHEVPVQFTGQSFVHPTAVLFNGGVFKAAALKNRVLEVLNHWLQSDGGQNIKELTGVDLDLAVSRGSLLLRLGAPGTWVENTRRDSPILLCRSGNSNPGCAWHRTTYQGIMRCAIWHGRGNQGRCASPGIWPLCRGAGSVPLFLILCPAGG